MANRRYYNQQFSLVPMLTQLFANVSFGASGAPTLNAALSKGVISVTRVSAGKYTFVFGTNAQQLDSYNSLLDVNNTFINATAPAAPAMYVTNNSTNVASSCSLTVQMNAAGTATDPGSGEVILFNFSFKNSSV